MNKFRTNLKKLTEKYSQNYIANKTGFSQSSINNYLSGKSEPSIHFLIQLKNAFGISVEDFLFSDLTSTETTSFDRFIGNYIVYYYNNSSYKGEVHTTTANALNYGVISIVKERPLDKKVNVYGTFFKDKKNAVKLLSKVNALSNSQEVLAEHSAINKLYTGSIFANEQSVFIQLSNNINNDCTFIIFNNPPSISNYIGGVGTVNTIARGREHNPCIEYIILSKKLLDKPDGEIFKYLQFNDYKVNFDFAIKDLIELFKRLYTEKNDLSMQLTENQKVSIIQNKLEYHYNEILQANSFRFAKISNKEDDYIYKLIKEGIDV